MKKSKIRKPSLSTVCYIIAAVFMVIAIYTAIVNILYLKNYAATYGVSLGAMWQDVVSYVISGFVPNFAYAFITFVLGKIVCKLYAKKENDANDSIEAIEVIDAPDAIDVPELDSKAEHEELEEHKQLQKHKELEESEE